MTRSRYNLYITYYKFSIDNYTFFVYTITIKHGNPDLDPSIPCPLLPITPTRIRLNLMQTSLSNIYALTDWIYSIIEEHQDTLVEEIKPKDKTKTVRLKSFIVKTSVRDHKIRINPNDRVDLVSEFLVFMVEKDKLKDFENKELNFNAVYWHFTQFITRDKYSGGQDVQRRIIEGVRTQSEQNRVKNGIETKTFNAPETHKSLSRKNEDGDVERDFVSNDSSPEELTIRSTTVSAMRNKVVKLFKAEYGEQWKTMFNVYENKLNETYDSMSEWSKVEGISLPTLKNRWSNIQDLLKKKGVEYFQTETSKFENVKMINKWISKGCPNLT